MPSLISSTVEIFGDGESGVSVLRTFRLMRIFKLIRFLPSLQKQVTVMVKTLDSVVTFLALLIVFIFTVSILGMHLFGAKIIFDGVPVRHNFDSLLWALMTTFQVFVILFALLLYFFPINSSKNFPESCFTTLR